MLENIGPALQEFTRNVRIIDIFDIALISVVLYLLLNWLIQSISKRTLIGFSVLGAIYIIARITGMYLTELLIQALFIVILIALVVVFQSDIRRIVDRIGSWRWFDNEESPTYSDSATNVIAEAVTNMAESQTGALIAIKGDEQWDRHIDGGIKLDGQLSIPLLFSIFNPQAPGHDGAVLLEGDKIVRFSTHLPLSKNVTKDVGGTRHAAALGLSEHCDALVIVISEESGAISIAQTGTFQTLESSSELKNILDEFWSEYYQSQNATVTDWWKKRNPRTAFASLLLASLLWFSFAYQPETVYRSFSVPIEYTNLQSSNVVLEDSIPMEARVTLSGPQQAFRSLNPADLVISFDMEEENINSEELIIEQNDINLPNDLRLYDADPNILNIEARPVQEVPVKITVEGSLSDELELINIESVTKTVRVFTEQPDVQLPDSIATEAIDLSTIDQSAKVDKQLILPSGINLAQDTLDELTISVEVQKKGE